MASSRHDFSIWRPHRPSIWFAWQSGWMKHHVPRRAPAPSSDSTAERPEAGSHTRFASGIVVAAEPIIREDMRSVASTVIRLLLAYETLSAARFPGQLRSLPRSCVVEATPYGSDCSWRRMVGANLPDAVGAAGRS